LASSITEPETALLQGKVGKFSSDINLKLGINKIVVKVIDLNGKQIEQVFEVSGSETVPVGNGENFYDHKIAIVIGVNKYSDFVPLEFAVNDAKSIKSKLDEMKFDKIYELYDKDATRSNILRVLSDYIPRTIGKNDGVVVYFAGHGLTEELTNGEMEGYIAPVDTQKSNYSGTAISMTTIRELAKKYRAKHTLLVFDSCYSGLGLKRSAGVSGPGDFIKKASQKTAFQIITAGGKDELAQEEKGHGVFTKSLLDVFDKKNQSSNQEIMLASDIGLFLRKVVTEKTKGAQTPAFGWLAGEGDFIFNLQ